MSVDWLAKFRPTLCVDVNDWDYQAAYPKDHFDFVWASPACTHFSIARTTGGPRDIQGATALVQRCLEIAEYFGCEWCLENPATGLLKRQPLIEGRPFTDVTYCRYGFDYRKQTRPSSLGLSTPGGVFHFDLSAPPASLLAFTPKFSPAPLPAANIGPRALCAHSWVPWYRALRPS